MLIILIVLTALFCACTESNHSTSWSGLEVDVTVDSLPGMLRISSQGETCMGTNESSAKANERPQMFVELNYEFSIGRHEVQCDEFNALMKKATGLSLNCASEKNPATDLTYYDAVLFANERSKSEGFDTAYTYAGIQFDAEKHCTNLEGYVFHPEKNAYRLPTEAEWNTVAETNWNVFDTWVAENSDYKLHDVCSKSNTEDQVCDLIGNAMEWVNDWNGNFRDTTLTNYVGAPDGGALGLRCLYGHLYNPY